MPADHSLDHSFMGETIETAAHFVADAERMYDRQFPRTTGFEEKTLDGFMKKRSLGQSAASASETDGRSVFNQRNRADRIKEFQSFSPIMQREKSEIVHVNVLIFNLCDRCFEPYFVQRSKKNIGCHFRKAQRTSEAKTIEAAGSECGFAFPYTHHSLI